MSNEVSKTAMISTAKVSAKLKTAQLLQQQGQLPRAAVAYREVLAIDPRNLVALKSLGVISGQSENSEEALRYLDAALHVAPDDASIHCNRGLALHKMRRLNEALASFDRAILLKRDYTVAHFNRGNLLREIGRADDALSSFDRAIAHDPKFALAWFHRGILLQAMQRLDAALSSYDRAIALNRDFAAAHHNRGVVLLGLRRFNASLASFDVSLRLVPDLLSAWLNRGVALHELKRFDAALASYDKAISLKPDHGDAYLNRATTLHALKDFDAALASLDIAVSIAPHNASIHYSRGVLLRDMHSYEAAIASFETAASLKPDIPFLPGDILAAKMQICDWKDFESDMARITSGVEDNEAVVNPFCLLYLSDCASLQQKAARIYVREMYPRDDSLGVLAERRAHDRIRIGYFSADFRLHPVSILMAEVFKRHDRKRFEITGFSLGPAIEDDMRKDIAASVDRFIDLGGMSDRDSALLARELEIDIAVDLGGFTADCRAGILALRAAPIQVCYLGYLGTMGADYIDYLLADPVLVGATDLKNYDESIVHLPSYQANASERPMSAHAYTREYLNLPASGVVFCCFNSVYKITPQTFARWMRILGRVDDSVLWLYTTHATAMGNLCNEAGRLGIDPRRLVFAAHLPLAEYLARYRAADLFLDTLPYNAGATASDALWAGLPLLTCAGGSLASRHAASLLQAIGVPELIASTPAHYEELAVELARTPRRLAEIRQKLTANRRTCRLFDTRLFTETLETAYAHMYRTHRAGLPPAPLAVN